MDFLINPNVRQYLYLYIAYAVIASILACFLLGELVASLCFLTTIVVITELYNMAQNEKTPDLQALSLTSKGWIFFAPTIAFFMILIINDDILSRTNYVTQKQQLQQTMGIIPTQHSHHRISGNKKSINYYYLTVNNINFHCKEEITDACDKVYQYKDKTATIYYQTNTKVGNLAYEIVVDNHKVYTFDNQLKFFEKQRYDENMRIAWFFILYFLPVFYFLVLYNDVIAQIPEMNEEKNRLYHISQKIDEPHQERKNATKRGKVDDLSLLNRILNIALLVLLIPFSLLLVIFVVVSIFNGKLIVCLFWSMILFIVYLAIRNRWQALKD